MPTRSLRLSLSTTTLGAVDRLRRTTERLSYLVEGFALSALSDEELSALTADRYAVWNQRTPGTLASWEVNWFARDLPATSARILLGGAGTGRELAWLRDAGYEVLSFDPIAPAGHEILCMSYEDLWLPVNAARAAAAARVRAGAPYDAIVLGWTSFTHVPGATRRARSLQALRALSSGPLLMSYWRRGGTGGDLGQRTSLPHRMGQRLGALLRASDVSEDRHHDRVVGHAGYAHCFSQSELDLLAVQCGYRAQHFSEGFAHTTLTPLVPLGCTA